jgi:hypothetical protein
MSDERTGRLKIIAISFFSGFVFCSLMFWAAFGRYLRFDPEGKHPVAPASPALDPGTNQVPAADHRLLRITVRSPSMGIRTEWAWPIDMIDKCIPALVLSIWKAANDCANVPIRDPVKIAGVKLEDEESGVFWNLYLLRWSSGEVVWTPEPDVGEPFDRTNYRHAYRSAQEAIVGLSECLADLEVHSRCGYHLCPTTRPTSRSLTTQEFDSEKKALTEKYAKLLREAWTLAPKFSAPASQP